MHLELTSVVLKVFLNDMTKHQVSFPQSQKKLNQISFNGDVAKLKNNINLLPHKSSMTCLGKNPSTPLGFFRVTIKT